jgi:uncharacterized protein YjbI with pentapeptide repeats
MNAVNRWILTCGDRVANIWYNQDYTVFGLNPVPGGQAPSDSNIVTLQNLGGGQVALQCGGGYNAFASMRDDYHFQVQFQAPYSANWITAVGGDEVFQIVPTGDGFFALHSPTFNRYVTIAGPDGAASNCLPLVGGTGNIGQAARFSAIGLDHASVLDLVTVSQNATGMSFAGVNLNGQKLAGNLSGCDFRQARVAGGVMDGADLQGALFDGLHLEGLSICGADCTGGSFVGCDFTGFVPGSPPPVLTKADVSRAVIPAGHSWTGARLHQAVLAGTVLAGADLSGPATDLSHANLGGTGVAVLTPTYQGGGIAGYDLGSPSDRVFAYDCTSAGMLDHLVCYRPGRGAIVIAQHRPDGTYTSVYFQGDGGNGIGGFTLGNPADRVVAFDYTGNGHLDHLLCYRPGGKLVTILQRNADGTFSTAFTSTTGLDRFPLDGATDQIIAFDWSGSGRLDHLLCYRPGGGLVTILQRNADGTFSTVFTSTTGIGGWDLAREADQIIAYDYEGNGNLDYVVCYRPGTGGIAILQHRGDDTFASVYFQGDPGNGIGDFSLGDPADRVMAYDAEGVGRLDDLFCYRPGGGFVRILQRQADGSFTPLYAKPGGIGGFDFANSADRAVAYDPAGTGKLNGLACCRPGTGTIWVIQPQAPGAAVLTHCDLGQANLAGADLTGTDLAQPASVAGANLSGASLRGATTAGVDLTGANLAATDFTGCDLTTTTFSSPFLRATDPNAPTVFAQCTLPYTVIGLDWSCLDLTGTTIVGLPTDLTGLVANGVRLPGGAFEGFVLDGANFRGATLDNAVFTKARLRNRPQFDGARLLGAVFTEAVLEQASFTGSTMGGVVKTEAAVFSFAFISNCVFTGANMYGVVFAGATLLSGNALTGTTSMEQADFSNCYLPGADFTGADLKGVKFDGAFMVQCVLTSADLSPAEQGAIPASLTSACLQAASLDGTKLDGADLAGAVITDSRGQIQQQYYDENGKLTPLTPMNYPAGKFPAPSSFNDKTICPNGATYGTNAMNGLTIAQMMALQPPLEPPTRWSPPGIRTLAVAHGGPR